MIIVSQAAKPLRYLGPKFAWIGRVYDLNYVAAISLRSMYSSSIRNLVVPSRLVR